MTAVDPAAAAEPAQFLNRELSWLEFNQRVLEEARQAANPILERLKFFCITSSNLDEFFQVRVAGLKQQIESGVNTPSLDGRTPAQTLGAVHERIRRMVRELYVCWREELTPELARHPLHQTGAIGRGGFAMAGKFLPQRGTPCLDAPGH
jgi:polyphosphate kinase